VERQGAAHCDHREGVMSFNAMLAVLVICYLGVGLVYVLRAQITIDRWKLGREEQDRMVKAIIEKRKKAVRL